MIDVDKDYYLDIRAILILLIIQIKILQKKLKLLIDTKKMKTKV